MSKERRCRGKATDANNSNNFFIVETTSTAGLMLFCLLPAETIFKFHSGQLSGLTRIKNQSTRSRHSLVADYLTSIV